MIYLFIYFYSFILGKNIQNVNYIKIKKKSNIGPNNTIIISPALEMGSTRKLIHRIHSQVSGHFYWLTSYSSGSYAQKPIEPKYLYGMNNRNNKNYTQ